eukprot:TRINITY_DN14578_c0_g1_i1.p1 TRINITY_DN14578_c0_g1~~TRINITY_DN14578_c0_g1_i1.p1  ORF type:complete len:126 (-),score=3.67 TRINITY_DN14578_c0_g1_i1:181-558(-)
MPACYHGRRWLALAGFVCIAGLAHGYRKRGNAKSGFAATATLTRNATSEEDAVDHGDDLDCYDLAGPKNISNFIGRSCWSNYGVNAGCGCFIGCHCKMFEHCHVESWRRELSAYAKKVGHCGWAS